jgi:hypothetical protein
MLSNMVLKKYFMFEQLDVLSRELDVLLEPGSAFLIKQFDFQLIFNFFPFCVGIRNTQKSTNSVSILTGHALIIHEE